MQTGLIRRSTGAGDSMSGLTARFIARREAILAAAAGEFNRQGIRGTTLESVASRVGLLKASLNYYYPRKEDLAAECMLQAISVLRAALAQTSGLPPGAAHIRAFIARRALIQADIANDRRGELVSFNEIRALAPPHDIQVAEAYAALFRDVRDLLPPAHPRMSRQRRNAHAHLLLALANAMPALLAAYEPDDYDHVAGQLAQMALDGLLLPGPRARAILEQALGTAGQARSSASLRSNRQGMEPAVPDAFLRVATALINDQGFRGASVERIAAQLDLTKGAFYHRLASKEDLVSQCFERSFGVIRSAQRAAQGQAAGGAQRLVRVVLDLVRFQLSDEGPLLRSSAHSVLAPEARRGIVERAARLTQSFAVMMVDGMNEGRLRIMDAGLAAGYVAAMINAAASLPRWAPGIDADEALAGFAVPVLAGLEIAADPPPQ